MNKELTDIAFWKKYWSSKPHVQKISRIFSFNNIFEKYLKNKNYKNMIEIGGFPGNYAIYFSKYFGYKSTILDFVVDRGIIGKNVEVNGLPCGNIDISETDFFKYKTSKKYDLVFSLGFIEHFNDTNDVINKHWQLVSQGGSMIIGLPNFLGLNGAYQILFDPDNIKTHNLNSMNIQSLKKIVGSLKPESYKVFYVSGKLVWLESISERSPFLRILTYGLNFVGLLLAKIGIRNRLISTHIFIVAKK